MSSNQMSKKEVEKLNQKAAAGETVVPGGKGGQSLEAQEHLAEGRKKGGETRKAELGSQGYAEMGRKGGRATKDDGEGEE